jgi:hypothetical protein
MRFVLCLLLACLAGSAAAAPAAAAPAAGTQRILFIGNSLTYTGDLPGRLAKLAHAMGRRAIVESVTTPGYSLEDHWREGKAEAAIRKGWDVVVLQPGAPGRPPDRAQLLESVRRFATPIRASGAKVALYMVWPASDRAQDFRGAISAQREAAAAVDAVLVPVGEAWLRAMSADKRLRLYADAIHPGSLGVDLAVLTFYFTFFPAGAQEFDDAFVAKLGRALELPPDRRDLLVDAATRAIDEPMPLE